MKGPLFEDFALVHEGHLYTHFSDIYPEILGLNGKVGKMSMALWDVIFKGRNT